ncbi:MAG: ABC transporter permease [Bacteroidetes bacterium]|nr:ABC transporter permease [Bacteroidota bacterium]
MFGYLIKKTIYSLTVLLGVVVMVFLLFNATTDNAASMTMGQRSDVMSIEAVNKEFGLDKPPTERLLLYINDLLPISIYTTNQENKQKYNYIELLNFNTKVLVLKKPYLRQSYQSRQGVNQIIVSSLAGTFVLALAAMLFACLVGILFGIICALYKDKWQDKSILFVSTIGISMPSFFAAIIISWFFGFLLNRYTGLDMTGSLYDYDITTGNYIRWRNLILPAFTLGMRPLAIITQLTRSSMLDILHQDFIRTAKAKGLSPTKVVMKHALRNALNPVITSVSGWFASLMAGAFFVEYVFNWKGIGKVTVEALEKSDLPVVMGAVVTVAAIFVVINLLVDLSYRWLDPRMR